MLKDFVEPNLLASLKRCRFVLEVHKTLFQSCIRMNYLDSEVLKAAVSHCSKVKLIPLKNLVEMYQELTRLEREGV